MVLDKINRIRDYAGKNIPILFFTIMSWQACQKIADTAMSIYFPMFSGVYLGIVELVISIVGLYWFSQID